jgi:hypothetical protein
MRNIGCTRQYVFANLNKLSIHVLVQLFRYERPATFDDCHLTVSCNVVFSNHFGGGRNDERLEATSVLDPGP